MSVNEFTFGSSKDVDQRTKDIVIGYIKQCQKLLPFKNNSYYNIPPLIEHVCIYYYWIKEYFTDHGDSIILNDDKNIATNTVDSYETVYGNILIKRIDNLYQIKW